MKLTVKTLKGGKFEIQADDAQTVAQVKEIIESQKSELPAASIKLIHSGKVLKDEEVISSCGIKESDFLVVMVTKPKKVAAVPEPVAAAASASTATTPKASDEKKSSEVVSSDAAPVETPASNTTTTPPTPAAPSRTDNFSDDAVNNLTAMGFPETEVRHCLRAANGNPDIAVEFLTNGIPDGLVAASAAGVAQTPSAGGTPLQSLRNHPQFDALRRVVQSNPAMLQQVLTQIGQQQPELLEEINANQAIFLQMMNEPVTNTSNTHTSGITQQSSTTSSTTSRSGGFPAGGIEGMGNPAQMAQMIQSMSTEELSQMASMMGLPPEQLRQTAQMIGQMPPEQLNQFMMQAMGGTDGSMGGAGGGLGGQHVLRLTEEEMAAVDRLAELGFDRSEAAQAFLACDKNEALAANLLMDSMGESGFGGGFSGADNDDNDGGDDDADDQMYD